MVDYGYHDQCIFLCDKNKIKETLNNVINKDYEELNFLDIIKYLNDDSISYYETSYSIKSFNTIDDLFSDDLYSDDANSINVKKNIN